MIVFKLERERPAYAIYQTTLYYVKVSVQQCVYVCMWSIYQVWVGI